MKILLFFCLILFSLVTLNSVFAQETTTTIRQVTTTVNPFENITDNLNISIVAYTCCKDVPSYCYNEQIIAWNTSHLIGFNGTQSIVNEITFSVCPLGCDSVTNRCKEASYVNYLYIFAVILIIIIVIGVVIRR